MNKDWLTEHIQRQDVIDDFDQIILEHKIDINQPHILKAIEKRNEFLNKMEANDELWRFHSGRSSFVSLSGRSGYSIVRDGEIIESYTTWVS